MDVPAYNGPTDFVHLHNHSLFSSLDGVQSPAQLVDAVAGRGWAAVAITEHGHMASVPDCYLAAKEKKIKYIAGCFLPYQPIYARSGVVDISAIEFNATSGETYISINFVNYIDAATENVRGGIRQITPKLRNWLSQNIIIDEFATLKFLGTGPRTNDMIVL